MWIIVFLCVFCLVLLFRAFIVDRKEEENEWKDIFDFVKIEDEVTEEKSVSVEKTYEKANNNVSVEENVYRNEDNIHEKKRKFSLKDAIIYSSIIERPYK